MTAATKWQGSQLPSTWPLGRLKDLVYLTNGFPFDSERFAIAGTRLVRIRDLASDGDLVFIDGQVPEEVVIQHGDLLVGMDGDFAAVTWRSGRAVLNQRLCRLRARRGLLDQRFLGYVLPTILKSINDVTYSTTVKHLSSLDLLNERLPLPPLDVQRAIADFLDSETARIDSLIALRNASIRLAIERFESTVYEAISHGVRTNTPLRPAGLDWLTDVPEHWRFPTVSANFTVTLGKMLSPEQAAGDEQYPYLRNQDVQWDRLVLDDLPTMHFGARDRIRLRLGKGDLLVCEGGEVGRSAEWRAEMNSCFFQKAIHRVRPSHGSPARFLMYCLRAAAKQRVFAVDGNQSTIVHLTREQLLERRLPFPPIDEQLEIVAVLDRRAAWLRNLTDTVRLQLAGLRERRQALITAAVTGEIDVSTASGRGVPA